MNELDSLRQEAETLKNTIRVSSLTIVDRMFVLSTHRASQCHRISEGESGLAGSIPVRAVQTERLRQVLFFGKCFLCFAVKPHFFLRLVSFRLWTLPLHVP